MTQKHLSEAFVEQLQVERKAAAQPELPEKLQAWRSLGRIPGWGLLAMFIFVWLVALATQINSDFWSNPAFHFKGEKVKAYVVDKTHSSNGKSGDDLLVVSFYTKDGADQVSEARATFSYFDSVLFNEAIEVVYNPRNPDEVYLVHGQDMPGWLSFVTLYIILPVVTLGTLVRYHKLLSRRIGKR